MRTLPLLGVATLLVVIGSSWGVAQSPPSPPPQSTSTALNTVPAGEYSDLTFWNAVKLGAASFVNPSVADRAAVAYKYQITPTNAATVDALLKSGKMVAIGTETASGSIYVDSRQPVAFDLGIDVGAGPKQYWAISSAAVPGLGNGQPVVAWDPVGKAANAN